MAMNSHDNEPIFLVGARRSGSTVLRLMLDHHPEIAWLNGFELSTVMVSDDGDWPDLEMYYEWLSTQRNFLSTGLEIKRTLAYPELVGDFLEQIRNRAGKPRIGATVHNRFDRLLHLWPKAYYLYLLRDGRDVARSRIGLGWAGNSWTGVQGWIDAERLWEQFRDKVPESQRFELKYEDLITDPVNTLTSVCKFVNVPFDPAMLTYPEDTTYDAPDPSLCEQWRRKMSNEEIQLAESRIGPMLSERGYALSNLPVIEISSWRKIWLRLSDRAARSTFRLKQYGWRLYLADIVARRTPLAAWKKRVRLRVIETQNEYMQ